MSLTISDISKSYGSQLVLDGLSLELNRGEVVGLLGRNGAGKSTLLKIVAQINLPDKGSVDIQNGNVGFLSERNPIYPYMYVREYLQWVGKVQKVQGLDTRVAWAISSVGLEDVLGKKVSQLSKGYKQRLGLAATLLSDPEVIILDEPISGLDPIQIAEYRRLVRALSSNKTIILSSHLLSEIEALCDRVLLLKDGHIMEDRAITTSNKLIYRLELNKGIDQERLTAIEGVNQIEVLSDTAYLIHSDIEGDVRMDIFDTVVEADCKILEMSVHKAGVNEIFR